MPERGGGNLPAYLVSAILILVFSWMGLQNHLNKRCGYHGAPQYECTPTDGETLEHSIPVPAVNETPQRQEWREEQDLNAQRLMAKWAFWMLVVSGVGVVVGAFGLFFLKRTLDETSKMTKATREIGENQSKAYAWVSEAYVSFPDDREPQKRGIRLPGESNISVRLTTRNDGETPATNVTAWATLQIFSSSGNALAPIKLEYEGTAIKNPKMRVVTKLKEAQLWLFIPDGRETQAQNAFASQNWAAKFGGNNFLIEGVLQYSDVFNDWYQSEFKFFGTVKNDGQLNPAFRSEEPEILFLKVETPRTRDE